MCKPLGPRHFRRNQFIFYPPCWKLMGALLHSVVSENHNFVMHQKHENTYASYSNINSQSQLVLWLISMDTLSIILFCHIGWKFLKRSSEFWTTIWVLKWLYRLGFLAGHTTPPTNFPSLSRRHHVTSSSLTITTLRTCLYSSQSRTNSIRCATDISSVICVLYSSLKIFYSMGKDEENANIA